MLYKRDLYIKKIIPFLDKPVIKVITGMRRVGKSYLLRLIMEELKGRGVKEENILYINKELLEYDFIRNYKNLDNYVKNWAEKVKGRRYLFVDEVQEIANWEKAILSFFSAGEMDIFITGSNAHLLSSDIATLLSGRAVTIPVFSLSFQEFLLFRGEKRGDTSKEFTRYLKFGGFPAIHHFDFNEEVVYQYINSLYHTILLKEIVKRNNIRNVHLLENITHYVFDNIGNIFSAKRVSDYLKSQKIRVGMETVLNYISYILATFVIHKIPRYDLKGKRLLEVNEKYYLGDIGIRHALLGYREADMSGMLENILFLELKRRGYQVYVGRYGDKEIDFAAEREGRRVYLQVSYLLASSEIIEREFSPLRQIKDNYPKYVISMDSLWGNDLEGIHRVNLIDFLVENYV